MQVNTIGRDSSKFIGDDEALLLPLSLSPVVCSLPVGHYFWSPHRLHWWGQPAHLICLGLKWTGHFSVVDLIRSTGLARWLREGPPHDGSTWSAYAITPF